MSHGHTVSMAEAGTQSCFWTFYTLLLHLGISFTQIMSTSLPILTSPKVCIHKPVMELCPQAGGGVELD